MLMYVPIVYGFLPEINVFVFIGRREVSVLGRWSVAQMCLNVRVRISLHQA